MTGGLLTGTLVLKHYLAGDPIASGGQSDVYRGTDQRNHRPVVIKQLMAGESDQHFEQELARFHRAAQLRISHPRIVDPIDSGEDNGEHFVIFPDVPGLTLDEYVRGQGGRVAIPQAVQILSDVLEGLAALDACGIVHRDLKPGNIMVLPDGHAVIIDLGICRIRQQATISRQTGGFGSPPWIPPEQQIDARKADHRSDLYALGLIARFMLAGLEPDPNASPKSPVQYGSIQQVEPSVPEHLDRICQRLLSLDPNARPQRAQDVLHMLSTGASFSGGAICTCGAALVPGARFCTRCGSPQGGSSQSYLHCMACGSPLADTSVCARCGSTFSPAGHHFRFASGQLGGRIFLIPESILAVGREQLDPQNPYISRRQFLLSSQNGTVLLQDAGGPNKTLVAGQPAVKPVELQPGLEIDVAGYVAIYSRQTS